MKLSDLIEELKQKHGDIPVKIETLTHRWDPEPIFKKEPTPFILLNP